MNIYDVPTSPNHGRTVDRTSNQIGFAELRTRGVPLLAGYEEYENTR